MIAPSTKQCFLPSRSWRCWPFCKYLTVSNSRGSEENLTGKKKKLKWSKAWLLSNLALSRKYINYKEKWCIFCWAVSGQYFIWYLCRRALSPWQELYMPLAVFLFLALSFFKCHLDKKAPRPSFLLIGWYKWRTVLTKAVNMLS